MPTVPGLVVRDAMSADVLALAAICKSVAIHRDRVRDADGETLRYVVAAQGGLAVAFGCLVLAQPSGWPEVAHVPQMLDLYVRDDLRSQGIGTALVRAMERMAREAGQEVMYVGVDPAENARALALYRRLGYEALPGEPVEERWEFEDSDGGRHSGVERLIYMRRALS